MYDPMPTVPPFSDGSPGAPPRCMRRCATGLALLASLLAAGCVDVPQDSPMGGAPMEDAAPPEVGPMSDALPHDGRMPERPEDDHDDPEAPEADGGDPGPGEVVVGGRPEDAEPGPAEDPPVIHRAGPDPTRCPDGGALLPVMGACARFEPLPDLPGGVAAASAVALPDGRIVLAGGRSFGDPRPVAETWVLEDDGWRAGPELVEPVFGAGAAVERGRMVLVGGEGGAEAASTVQVVHVDGEPGPTAMLDQPRIRGFSAHRLEAGRIVVVGGETLGGIAGVEEVPLPQQQMDTVIDQLAVARRDHAAAVDAEGALWVLGGLDRRGQVRFAPEVLAPDAVEWASAPGPAGWAMLGGALAPTGDSVLFAGGADADGRPLRRAGIYDHESASWRAVGGLNEPQARLVLAPLGEDGALLAIGPGALEIYDPVEARFRRLEIDAVTLRAEPAVVVWAGEVFVLGGESQGRSLSRCYRVSLAPARPPVEPEEGPEAPEGEDDGDGRR